ncbi:hypothetical protein ACVIN2_002464 [Bradyrhizobium sp. USDA 3650]
MIAWLLVIVIGVSVAILIAPDLPLPISSS